MFSKRSFKEYFDLFRIYVRPILEYNITFWFPHFNKYVKLLENVQKKFTKRICPPGLNYPERLKLLFDSTIEDRSYQYRCHLVYKSIHGLLNAEFSYSPCTLSTTRGNCRKLLLPYVRSSVRKSYCTIRSISDWNRLPNSVTSSPNFYSFKRALVTHTLELRA